MNSVLDNLTDDKRSLVTNLIVKGREVTDAESFTSLIPEVNAVPGGYLSLSDMCNTVPTDLPLVTTYTYCYNSILSIIEVLPDDLTFSLLDYSGNYKDFYRIFPGLKMIHVSSAYTPGYNFSFFHCKSLRLLEYVRVDSGFSWTPRYYDLGGVFESCESLKSFDFSFCTFPTNIHNYYLDRAFKDCTSLEYLNMGTFDFVNSLTSFPNFLDNVPTTCEIVVNTSADVEWFATNYPTYTNVHTAIVSSPGHSIGSQG